MLSTAINGLDQDHNNINAPAFASAVGGIPTAASLGGAQAARTAAIKGHIPPPPAGGGGTPTPFDAPPPLTAQRASDLKSAFDFVNNQATATGNLGGYGDSWFNSGLTEQDAARRIGVGNKLRERGEELDFARAGFGGGRRIRDTLLDSGSDAGCRQHAWQLRRQERQPQRRAVAVWRRQAIRADAALRRAHGVVPLVGKA